MSLVCPLRYNVASFPFSAPHIRMCLTVCVCQALQKTISFNSPWSVEFAFGIYAIRLSEDSIAARPLLRPSRSATICLGFSRSLNTLHRCAHLSLSMCRVRSCPLFPYGVRIHLASHHQSNQTDLSQPCPNSSSSCYITCHLPCDACFGTLAFHQRSVLAVPDGVFQFFWHLFINITPSGEFIFYSHSKTKQRNFHLSTLIFWRYVLEWYFSQFRQKTKKRSFWYEFYFFAFL